MDRRKFVRRTAGIIGGAAVGSGLSSADRAWMPTVTTRGHFTVDWMGQTHLADGYGKYEYETRGEVPGYHTDESPEEVCVFVHGWLESRDDVERNYPQRRGALRRAGFDGPMIMFSWDSESSSLGWWIKYAFARRNGHKLATFLRDYRARNPETRIRVIGFSLGAATTAGATKSLFERDWSGTIDSLAMLGGSVDDQSFAVDGKYGPAAAQVWGEVDNFYKSDDKTLNNQYQIAEFDGAIGSKGLEGTPPHNYEDHRVDHVQQHSLYWRYEEGCIRAVVEEWQTPD